MGVSVATNRGGSAPSATATTRNSSGSISFDALRAEYSSKPNLDDSMLSAAKVAIRKRQQVVLAQLVEAVDPENADRLATSLIERFGSLGGVFAAPTVSIARCANSQILATTLMAAKTAVVESMREDVRRVRFDPTDRRIMDYLIATMHGAVEEHLHAIFLDSRLCYLADERVSSGSYYQISVEMNTILRRGIELNSAVIVLFHNHPSGDLSPSQADIEFTREATVLLNAIGVNLYDHLIVSGPRVYSMRLAGQL